MNATWRNRVWWLFTCRLALCLSPFGLNRWSASADEPNLMQWGSDHVGQRIPDYMTGDECLFCHRDVGANWSQNPHQKTLRTAVAGQSEIQSLAKLAPELAREVEFLLGGSRLVRYLKRSQSYGKLELLTARYKPTANLSSSAHAGQLLGADRIGWHGNTFGDRCAGCHATAVDPAERTFAATSLDCYVCHGTVVHEHTQDVSKVLLSRLPQDPLVVNSICSSCHLRGGHSQSTKLPFPNTFVPGDNLFRDFQVDLSDSAIAALPVMQQHIYLSARLAGSGQAQTTCIDCHSVHGNDSRRHLELPETRICAACHLPNTDNRQLLDAFQQYDNSKVQNSTCDF